MTLTRHTSTPLAALHKACDGRALTVTSALSVEVLDRAGDVVVPRGVDLRVHKADPWAGLEHYRHKGGEWVLPGPGDDHLPPVRVGTAADAAGAYGVVLKNMPGHGEVLFATTRFDPSDQLSLQTYRLVEDGTLDGTSVEIALLKGHHRPLDKSPLENRYGQHIERCTLLGYAHCAVPVNQAALVCKSLPAHAEQAVRVVQTGRVGAEPAHPLILKALARFAPAGKSTTVTGGFDARVEKAMPDAEMTPAYADEAAPETDAEGGDELSAVYDVAQQLEDAAGTLEALAEDTASVHLIKDLPKLAAVVRAAAEKVKGGADKHQDMIDAARGGQDEPEPKDEPADMDKDDDGVLKAMAPRHYKAVKAARVRRFSKAEVAAAPVASPEPADPIAARAAQLAELQQTNPKAYARLAGVARDTAALTR